MKANYPLTFYLHFAVPLQTLCSNCSMYVLPKVWKNEKFTLTKKIFIETNSLVISLVKQLLSRNFCWKSVGVNFHNFHSVLPWWLKFGLTLALGPRKQVRSRAFICIQMYKPFSQTWIKLPKHQIKKCSRVYVTMTHQSLASFVEIMFDGGNDRLLSTLAKKVVQKYRAVICLDKRHEYRSRLSKW